MIIGIILGVVTSEPEFFTLPGTDAPVSVTFELSCESLHGWSRRFRIRAEDELAQRLKKAAQPRKGEVAMVVGHDIAAEGGLVLIDADQVYTETLPPPSHPFPFDSGNNLN